MAGQSLDTRLRRIEQKLGIADEQIAQEFAEHVHKRLDRLDQRLKSLERMVLGENRYQEAEAGQINAAAPRVQGLREEF